MVSAFRRYSLGLGVGVLLGSLVVGCRLLGLVEPRSGSPEEVTVLWSGGVTPTAARVHVRVPEGRSPATVQLAVSQNRDFSKARHVAPAGDAAVPGVYAFALDGLKPGTEYHYALAVEGQIDRARAGRFRTFKEVPHAYRVALGGCARTGSQHRVFDVIRRYEPNLMLHLGDMHYEDIDEADPALFQAAYHKVHASPAQSALYRAVPITYMWDDHDYGPNNSSRRAPGQDVAQRMYRAYVPHYPLPARASANPIYQAFTIGRVRFIVTDLRSARTANGAEDAAHRTMMDIDQKAWFKDQLLRARDAYPVIAWVSSVPWIANDPDALDRWSGYPEERRELATFIDSIGVADQMVVLSGDAHMVALDDGTNNHYGLPGGGGFPVVHAAALDQPGSVKGGPYTHGPFPNRRTLLGGGDGQFVLMDVQDDGGNEVCVTWTGKRVPYDAQQVIDLLEWTKCFPAGP